MAYNDYIFAWKYLQVYPSECMNGPLRLRIIVEM